METKMIEESQSQYFFDPPEAKHLYKYAEAIPEKDKQKRNDLFKEYTKILYDGYKILDMHEDTIDDHHVRFNSEGSYW